MKEMILSCARNAGGHAIGNVRFVLNGGGYFHSFVAFLIFLQSFIYFFARWADVSVRLRCVVSGGLDARCARANALCI